jgi:hypothetical protein
MLDAAPPSNVILPPALIPTLPVANGSYGVAQFYMLKDKKTGVLALGSFSDPNYFAFVSALVQGLTTLKNQGATKLVVDVVRQNSYKSFSPALTNHISRPTMVGDLFAPHMYV